MNAVRLGSYSMRTTIPSTSNFRRLKSDDRGRDVLRPPPRRRMVIRPVLFRPAFLVRPSVRAFTGRPFQSSERSISTSPRWPGVVGLYDLSAMLALFRLLRPGVCPLAHVCRGSGRYRGPKEHHPGRIRAGRCGCIAGGGWGGKGWRRCTKRNNVSAVSCSSLLDDRTLAQHSPFRHAISHTPESFFR